MVNKMQKIDMMVIVPHEDDELAIAGPMIYAAIKKKMHIKVVFSTNGDFYAHEGEIRLKEAVKSLNTLGVEVEDIIFLGYGDQTRECHLYNGADDIVICAYNGNDTTYGLPELPEFAWTEYGEHHKYTRNYYKSDVKAVIKKYLPQIIITTGWDMHMDHLALSLMLDEVLGEILKEEINYQPLYLQSQAYTGKWEGNADYYEQKRTEYVNLSYDIDKEYPLNKWEDRICFSVPKECQTKLLKNNVLYQAACAYKSQSVDLKAIQFINADLVFWRRPTESLLHHAKIEVSSGENQYLNDFKCHDCTDIVNSYQRYDKSIWTPNKEDLKKRIDIELDMAEKLSEIHFFECTNSESKIMNLKISFDNGAMINTGELNHDGSRIRIVLPKMPEVKNFSIIIDKWNGENIGLTEIEVFGKMIELSEYPLPLSVWKSVGSEPVKVSFSEKLERFKLRVVQYGRGRIWPWKYYAMKRDYTLKETDSMVRFWWEHLKFVRMKLKEK